MKQVTQMATCGAKPLRPGAAERCRHLVYFKYMKRTGLRYEHRKSAQDVNYRWLRHRIDALPRESGMFVTEGEVSSATGTSRTPVREALQRLEAEGFLEIVPKKGAFVPPISDSEVDAVMQARAIVEEWCVRQASTASASLLAELEELLEAQRQLIGNAVSFIQCDREFHRSIVSAAGNQVLADFYESLRERQLRMGLQAIADSSERLKLVLAEHAAIVEGIRSASPDMAARALLAHLSSTLSALRHK